MDSHCFKLHWSYLISFNLSNVDEILCGINQKGPSCLSLEKEKENFCVVLTYSIKRARETRMFYVAVVQQRLRNVQKSVMHVQSCYFANLNLLLFCCSPLQKLPVVVIQKFCFHGNVTSHFSSLFVRVNAVCPKENWREWSAQCSESVKSRLASIWFVWKKKQDFVVAREQ